ncbi:hypothetical protein POTOM_000014 [Populus tomentosa]|uniref:Cytochrome P450 n=1 Tax=Populus tomentosa TaxID=118781 RepID=A0A8X8AQH3_POPTO|nr:hypothetical protein POTOM_000014 [Populus tomentosa]
MTTSKDPTLFPNAEQFGASRYEGAGPAPYSYVPFGGGPRICLGNEYARPQILVFLHNIFKRFKWDLMIPDEKVPYDPMPAPSQVKKMMKSSLSNVVGDDAKRTRKMLLTSLDRDALKRYIDRMDLVAQNHIRTHWEVKKLMKLSLANVVGDEAKTPRKILMTSVDRDALKSIDDPIHISKLAHHFDIFLKGVIHFPIWIPGTTFYRASKSGDALKEEIRLGNENVRSVAFHLVREREIGLKGEAWITGASLVGFLLFCPMAACLDPTLVLDFLQANGAIQYSQNMKV